MSETEHQIVLKNAKELQISGVDTVHSATPTAISCNTTCGGLVIKGKQLHVEKLDVESKILEVTGNVEEMRYVPAKKSIVKRLFK